MSSDTDDHNFLTFQKRTPQQDGSDDTVDQSNSRAFRSLIKKVKKVQKSDKPVVAFALVTLHANDLLSTDSTDFCTNFYSGGHCYLVSNAWREAAEFGTRYLEHEDKKLDEIFNDEDD